VTSNIDLPNFPPFEFSSEKSRAVGKSKKYRDAALAKAFLAAEHGNGYKHRHRARAINFQARLAMAAYTRLMNTVFPE
jgi:acyl CoA:acetate/3-ketoacid CoA transferase alpha subunit